MTKPRASLLCVVAIPIVAGAFPIGRIAFNVAVVEEGAGRPLVGIPVTAVFNDQPTRWGDDTIEKVRQCLTDAKGRCRFTGTSNHGAASYYVEKVPGYYATVSVAYSATNQVRNFLPYRCEPYDCVFTTILQRVERPVSLYVKRVQLRDPKRGIGGFDGTNAVLRFDFVSGDWLPPHGNGRRADFEIRTRYRLKEVVKDPLYRGLSFYEFTSEVAFLGEGNGLVERSFAGVNCGIKLRTAPEGGYASGKTLRFGRRRKKSPVMGIWPEDYTESDFDRCYCFRVRSRFDERGRLVEAYYGKIYGDFNFEGWWDVGFCGVAFLYYLNPRPLDRNLEWDVKRNLCPDPGNLQYRPVFSRVYPEP